MNNSCITTMTKLSQTFRCRKNQIPNSNQLISPNNASHKGKRIKTQIGTSPLDSENLSRIEVSNWTVYLIISSRLPKTYVGVTTNFPRRLRQHNGELKGGAKASAAGRPWNLACLVHGFKGRSEACEFEYKWKSISRKLPRKKKNEEDQQSNLLLKHREAALTKIITSFDCSGLQIDWESSSS